MTTIFEHQLWKSPSRDSQSLRNDRCQNILYKAVFEHFTKIKDIAALLLASKSFQNSSFGANLVVNFVVNDNAIVLLDSVLSPLSCFSLQFVPSLHIKQVQSDSDESEDDSGKINGSIANFVREVVNTKYLHSSLRSLKLENATSEVRSFFFGSSSNDWPQLQDLTLEHCELHDFVLEVISKNAIQLRALNLSASSGITASGLEHISTISSITVLNLAFCRQITDAGLEHVAKHANITSLDLSGCDSITNSGLERISLLSNITSLDLCLCDKITDEGLELLLNLAGITSLNLSGCQKITDAGMKHISQLSGITSLLLRNCRMISDSGVQHLVKLSNITSLDLSYSERITDEAKARFETAVPNCNIIDQLRKIHFGNNTQFVA